MDYNILSGYGVSLKRLTENKIELVRRWRNDPKVSQYMEYREIITPEAQRKWFYNIDNNFNYYFLIMVGDEEIGLINVRDINYKDGTGEPGIFIWDDKYLNSTYSFNAALCLHDFCFFELRLNLLIIHVLNDNKRAIKYNRMLGYILAPDQECIYNQKYTMTLQRYIECRDKLIKYL